MSIQAIFDPVVRAYFKKKYGGGGGTGGGPVVINGYGLSIAHFQAYDVSELLGTNMFKASDDTPTIEELSRNALIFMNQFSGLSKYSKYTQKGPGTYGPNGYCATENEEIPGMVVLGNDTGVYVISLNQNASKMLAEVGVELPPGIYFTQNAFYGSEHGPIFIYNL